MSALLWFAIALTRAWTATYTRGLPADLRAERREEIDCDLWEHQRLADLQREPVTGTAIEILFRLIFGVPSDLTWRLEARASTQRRISVNESMFMRGAFVAVTLLAAVPGVMGVMWMLGDGEWDGGYWIRLLLGSLALTGSAGMIIGLLISRTDLKRGLIIIGVAALATSVLFFWMAFLILPAGVAIFATAYFRSKNPEWPSRGPRPA